MQLQQEEMETLQDWRSDGHHTLTASLLGDAVTDGAVAGAIEAKDEIFPPFLRYRQGLNSFLLLHVNAALPKIFISLSDLAKISCVPFF